MSAPLSKTEEIVLLGDDRAASEVSRLLASVPPSVQALTGVDITKVSILFGFHSLYAFSRCHTHFALTSGVSIIIIIIIK